MKIPKSLNRLDKDTQKVLNWVASVYNYMKETDDELQKLKEDLGGGEISRSEKDIRRAIKDFYNASRSESKFLRLEDKVENDIQELMKILPDYLKREFEDIEKHLRISVAFLINNASLFRGEIKKKMKFLKVQIQLLEKEEKRRPVQLDKVRILKAITAAETQKLIERVELTIKWVASLGADIKNVEHWKDKLMKMAA